MQRSTGLATLLVLTTLWACSAPARPSLLLITIDTLRADHLSCYGYSRPTSPRIDALANRGVLFETTYSPTPLTQPACSALLTGRWPAELGVRGNAQPLPANATTLAEILSAEGYATAGFVSGFPLVRRLSALDQGFSHFDDDMPDPRGKTSQVQRSAEETTAAVLAWLQSTGSEPYFLWVHYYDPHGDYAPPPPYDEMFVTDVPGPLIPIRLIPAYQRHGRRNDAALFTALYDGEIRRVDTQIGRLLDEIERRGDAQTTLIVVTADHGESLTEHDYFLDHGNELYLPSTHIPLIMSGPGLPSDGRRISGISRTVDIAPTILDLLGVNPPTRMSGGSLVPALGPDPRMPAREALSETRFVPYKKLSPAFDTQPKIAVRDERFTAILRLTTGATELYDRSNDPGELRNLLSTLDAASAEELAQELKRRLEDQIAVVPTGRGEAAESGRTSKSRVATPVFSPDLRKRLEALTP